MDARWEKQVRLRIRGEEGNSPEAVEREARGTLAPLEGGYLLIYRETEEPSRVTLRLLPGGLVMEREGECRSRMVFREGRAHLARYDTPWGSIPMRLHTRSLRSSLGEWGGEIHLSYTLELGGGEKNERYISILVQEENEHGKSDTSRQAAGPGPDPGGL